MIYNIVKDNYLRFPEKQAICQGHTILTYRDLYHGVDCIAHILQTMGIKHRDKVVIMIDRSASFIVAFFAINKLGAVCIPVFPKTKQFELTKLLKRIEPQVTIISKEDVDHFHDRSNFGKMLAIEIDDNKLLWSISKDTATSGTHITDLSSFVYGGSELVSVEEYDEEEVAEILFTSGSTGEPKGTMLTNKNVLANILNITEYLNLGSEIKSLIIKSMVHSSTINGEILVTLYLGGTLVIVRNLVTPRVVSNHIDDYQINALFLVPTLLQQLIEYIKMSNKIFHNLKVIHFYGSTISDKVLHAAFEVFPASELIYSYGLTEAAPRVTYILSEDLRKRVGSSGKPVHSVQIKLFAEHGVEVTQPHEVGEIYVQGPTVMKGYYNDPENTRRVLRPEGLRTGDLGYLDEEGFLYVVGRQDDMFTKNGINIYPTEIENILYLYPGIQWCLVKGEEFDTEVKIIAYIVPEEGATLAQKALFKHCIDHLNDYKVPDQLKIVSQLDMTASGKIKRK